MDTKENPVSVGRRIGSIIGTVLVVLLALLIASDVADIMRGLRDGHEFFSHPYGLPMLFVKIVLLIGINWSTRLPKSSENKTDESNGNN